MSWSFNAIGRPSKIVIALDKFGETLTGASKDEFMEVAPSMKALLTQNFNTTEEPLVEFSANGHGYTENGVKKYGNCLISIKALHGSLYI